VQYEVEVSGTLRQVRVTRRDGRFIVVVGDRQWVVDAAQIGSHVLSLLIDDVAGPAADSRAVARTDDVALTPGQTRSCEIAIGSDPATGQFVFGIRALPLPVAINPRRRFGRGRDSADGHSGPQRIVAPMPGKIVRVLGKPGDAVAHRQPVVVIEAMKMENELRALRDGTVAEVLVQEGQSVEAGTLLAVITPS
jgi:biotin carboxyl carrier protein